MSAQAPRRWLSSAVIVAGLHHRLRDEIGGTARGLRLRGSRLRRILRIPCGKIQTVLFIGAEEALKHTFHPGKCGGRKAFKLATWYAQQVSADRQGFITKCIKCWRQGEVIIDLSLVGILNIAPFTGSMLRAVFIGQLLIGR